MNKIHVLDEKTASKIAAGEVIERPAGVLKELLENAVDAGATRIRVDLKGSGKDLIRVNDDGCGMSGNDLEKSVLRHATSKIKSFEDLEKLHTFGFRGEALYSIAAVSRMTLISCNGKDDANRLEIQAGKITSKSPAPAVQGTTVEIRDLFYNVPARLKFLKSDSYERACLLKVAEESALANLRVGYCVYANEREVYNLPAPTEDFQQAVRQRASAILGEEVASNFLFKQFTELGLQLFITPVDKLVNVRDMQYIFVNGRPVDSKTVQQAIYKAYQNVRPKDRHPAFVAYLTLPPSEFDVNIHPQKRDIRFVEESRVFNYILHAAGELLFEQARPVEAQTLIRVSLPKQAQTAARELFIPSEPKASQEDSAHPLPAVNSWDRKQSFGLKETEDPSNYTAKPFGPFQEAATPAREGKKPGLEPVDLPDQKSANWYIGPYHYLGQLQRSYLVFENPLGLVLIDQHAAQERVLFEHYLDAFDKRAVNVQKLLFPLHVDLPPSNAQTLLSWKEWLKTAGFEIEPFSARTILVHTRPHMIRFQEDDLKEFIVSLAQLVGDPTKSTETLKRKMVAMLACKKAIKAHDAISAAEAEALLENMKKCKDGMHCPHGRPCVAQLAMKDIGKLFGR